MSNSRIPMRYDMLNMIDARVSPNVVHSTNTAVFHFYVKYLLQRLISVFKFEGLPEEWAENYFSYVLFGIGYVAIINTDRYGIIPQKCTVGDRITLFRQPQKAIVTNPVFDRSYELLIGKQCEVIKMQPDWGNGLDIVSTYADLMTMAIESAGINMYNSKAGFVFFADSKAGAESFKKAYDEISSGNPLTVIDKSLMREDGSPAWQFFTPDVGSNYITGNLLNDMRTLENQFNSMIGIPNANTQKRERLITSEVEANAVEVSTLPIVWLETMRKDIEKVNRMFGLNISVSLRYAPENGLKMKEVEDGDY